ncbi:actin-like protein [Encephalitozoon intestinalis ATCC 50506]|uniref:Actin-like protein n=1 Tax=Encephalitozoon intestinalis (strain ATCC 50506) TaxID=876142 RepID=E0S759_ENCIT|nr:actin-like protein [Encephalitozoon intestinalis ATCC 50506]ADM11487.1 actin-like protein [Encephalitozoon intestinalis ATCC 50506]UTX45199.1 hypothetical protein GPK93_05g07430 [Encephalitozoon intestinalis]
MYLELQNLSSKNRYERYRKSDTIVIDNGTYECKAGYSGDGPQMVFKNILYRHKTVSSIESFQGASPKTMFDGDVVTNFEVLENVIDEILEYLKPEKLKNLIFTEKIFNPTHEDLVKFLFDVYGFEKIQIGVDSYYSYLWNMSGEDCMVVDMAHSATTCLVICGGRIMDVYKINFGGKAAGDYLSALMFNKFFNGKKNYKGLIPYLRCSLDYRRETVQILEEMKVGNYSRNYFLDEELEMVKEKPVDKKQKMCAAPMVSTSMPEIDMCLLNTADVDLDPEEIKEKKKQKILYHSTLHRLKTRVEKCLEKLSSHILYMEDEREKLEDLEGFISKKKTELQALKRELEIRSRLRRDVKNRKTYEFQVRFKEGELTADEKTLVEKIRDAEDLDKENKILESLKSLIHQIKELDPYFEPYTADTVDLLSGHFIGRMNANVDLLKIPEIVFSPSIIGLDQMGLTEIMEDVSKKYRVKKVLLTGGFSQIKDIDVRIRNEMTSMSFVGEIEVIKAKDPIGDSFRGARICEAFPTYTLEEYNRSGIVGVCRIPGEKSTLNPKS